MLRHFVYKLCVARFLITSTGCIVVVWNECFKTSPTGNVNCISTCQYWFVYFLAFYTSIKLIVHELKFRSRSLKNKVWPHETNLLYV